MTRVLLVHGGGGLPGGVPEGVEVETVEARGTEAVVRAVRGAKGKKAEALVVAPDGACEPDGALAAALREAGVPTVQAHARNVEADGGAPPSAAGATAVVHGFGDRSLALALAAAARLARRGG